MNYIWELLIKAKQQGFSREIIHFTAFDSIISPHLEMLAEVSFQTKLNSDIISKVDVNPYFRFMNIFDKLFIPRLDENKGTVVFLEPITGAIEYEELINALLDIILHYLAEIDLNTGMSKRDFYTRFVISDLENGVYGNKNDVKLFSFDEKMTIAHMLLVLYKTGNYFDCLLNVTLTILPFCQIIICDNEDVLFYNRLPKDEETEKKIRFIIKLFLPLYINFTIHWVLTYGMVGYDNTMRLEEFIL